MRREQRDARKVGGGDRVRHAAEFGRDVHVSAQAAAVEQAHIEGAAGVMAKQRNCESECVLCSMA